MLTIQMSSIGYVSNFAPVIERNHFATRTQATTIYVHWGLCSVPNKRLKKER